MTEVMLHATAGMVAVGVGDDGTCNRLPRIDVEIALCAINSSLGEG